MCWFSSQRFLVSVGRVPKSPERYLCYRGYSLTLELSNDRETIPRWHTANWSTQFLNTMNDGDSPTRPQYKIVGGGRLTGLKILALVYDLVSGALGTFCQESSTAFRAAAQGASSNYRIYTFNAPQEVLCRWFLFQYVHNRHLSSCDKTLSRTRIKTKQLLVGIFTQLFHYTIYSSCDASRRVTRFSKTMDVRCTSRCGLTALHERANLFRTLELPLLELSKALNRLISARVWVNP